MKKRLVALSAAATLFTAGAFAHGPAQSMHGGVVQTASDLQFELVPRQDGADLYVIDHGKPADASRASGKLTVLDGARKTEAELKPAGANRLQATQVRMGTGAKAVAVIHGMGDKPVILRFVLP